MFLILYCAKFIPVCVSSLTKKKKREVISRQRLRKLTAFGAVNLKKKNSVVIEKKKKKKTESGIRVTNNFYLFTVNLLIGARNINVTH